MELNENTYSYIRKVFFQLEGITCALAVLFEKSKSEVCSYHYSILNETYNGMRDDFIETVKWITDDFDSVKITSVKTVDIMRGSEESKEKLTLVCNECQDCINRLIIRCNNIDKIEDSTENPWIPNADEDVYKIFSGYKGILDDYPIQYSEEDDNPISKLFESFYKTCVEKYDKLFEGYNDSLNQLGISVETKKFGNYMAAGEKAKSIVKKNKKKDAINDIVGAASGFGITLAEALVPAGIAAAAMTSLPLAGVAAVGIATKAATAFGLIEKKDFGDVAREGIGLISKISENLDDIIPEDEDNKSAARELLKSFEYFDHSIKIAEEVSSEASGLENMVLGTMIASTNPKQVASMKENGSGDVLISGVAFSDKVFKTLNGIYTGDYKSAVLTGLQIPSKAIQLIEKSAKYLKKNEIPSKDTVVGKMLYMYGEKLEKHEKSIEKFKYDKARGFPALKPKKPYWILEKGSSLVGSICKKIDENGDDIIEFGKSIL